jgi:hypothetical protein
MASKDNLLLIKKALHYATYPRVQAKANVLVLALQLYESELGGANGYDVWKDNFDAQVATIESDYKSDLDAAKTRLENRIAAIPKFSYGNLLILNQKANRAKAAFLQNVKDEAWRRYTAGEPEMKMDVTSVPKTYPTTIVLRDLTPQERLLFPITLNSKTSFGKKFPSVTKIFVYSEEHIIGTKQIPALPEPLDVYLKLLHNGHIIEQGDSISIEDDSIYYRTNFDGNLIYFSDENDPASPAIDVKIIYVKLETLYQDKDTFDLIKNQTITTQAYNQALSVTVTDDNGLNVTIAKGQANYPYNGQLVLVFQQNQLVLQANDMNRKIYVKGNMS